MQNLQKCKVYGMVLSESKSTDTAYEGLQGNYDQKAGGVVVVHTTADALRILEEIYASESVVAIDTETTGCDPKKQSPVDNARIACWSLAYFPKQPIGAHGVRRTPLAKRVFIPNWGAYGHTLLGGTFRAFLEGSHPKVGHSITTYDMHAFENHGIKLGGVIGDTLRISKLLKSTKLEPHDLKYYGRRQFGYYLGSYEELFSRPKRLADDYIEKETTSKKAKNRDFPVYKYPGLIGRFSHSKSEKELIPLEDIPERYPQRLQTLIDYATLDAKITLELWYYLTTVECPKIKTKLGDLNEFNNKLWHPGLLILNRMERVGIRFDKELAATKAEKVRVHQTEYLGELNQWATLENWGSTDQLSDLLYNKLSLPVPPICGSLKAIKKTPKGKKPTSEAALYWLEMWVNRNGLQEHAIGLRNLRGFKKTIKYLWYLETIPAHLDKAGRVRSVIAPETDTGRLSAKVIPLQGIPGRDPYRIRDCFTASPGHCLVVADFAGLELYILAHMMIKVLKGNDVLAKALQSGDVYGQVAKTCWPEKLADLTATQIKGCGIPELTKLREHSKITVLSTNYGKGAEGLALSFLDELGEVQTVEYGEQLQQGYFNTFPVLEFQAWASAYVRKHGYIPTLFGRTRPIPQSQSRREWELAQADRMAWNTPMQGSGADIMTQFSIMLDQHPLTRESGAVQVLSVHDELVVETPESTGRAIEGVMKELMESDSYYLALPLKGELKVCNAWGEAK